MFCLISDSVCFVWSLLLCVLVVSVAVCFVLFGLCCCVFCVVFVAVCFVWFLLLCVLSGLCCCVFCLVSVAVCFIWSLLLCALFGLCCCVFYLVSVATGFAPGFFFLSPPLSPISLNLGHFFASHFNMINPMMKVVSCNLST